jgi:L-alanine-DL-glutamate epimerase-like enolase superfamily enzyme
MAKPTDITIIEANFAQQRFAYRTPMKFGGRVVNDAVVFDVTVRARTRDRREGIGFGSMTMGNVWAWPSRSVDSETTLDAMLRVAEVSVQAASDYKETAHPLAITHELAAGDAAIAADVERQLALDEPMPPLARMVATSPLHAAIHDAQGKICRLNSYNMLGEEFVDHDLATYLGDDFHGEYLDRYTLRTPKPRMPLYHLVGALDVLTDGDIVERIDDGLPETLGGWIAADGLTHLKIKLNGDDLKWDVDRVASVDRVVAEAQSARGCESWNYSLDFNERCADVQYVLDFLGRLEARAPQALVRVHYIEQPTHRDLRANPENRMHAAARIKPVVIDESLIDMESLMLCREMGYSGVALKACKGHGDALLMGAAAQKYGMFLCVQDLTCPGASFLHSATLSARFAAVEAIEGNARQYCPAGNAGWSERFPSMFNVTDGTLGTAVLDGPGLGF